MNTNSAARPHARIGLIETPELGALLQRAGFDVVTGPDFRSSAMTIRSAIQSSGGFPLVVADAPAPGLGSYIERIAKTYGVPVVILRNPEAPTISSKSAIEVPIPATLDEILEAAGLPPLGGADGDIVYPIGRQVPAEDEEDWDHWDEAETTQISQVQQEAVPAPERRQPTPPVQAEDVWVAPVQETPAPRQSRPQPAPAAQPVDNWDTPAPAQPAPADAEWDEPVHEAAEPARQRRQQPAPAPQPLDEWNAPAPVQPVQEQDDRIAPAQEGVAPARQRRQEPVEEWNTPAPVEDDWDVPAQVRQRSPQPAPAPQQVDDWDVPAQVQQVHAHDDWDTPAPEAPARQRRPQPAPAPQQVDDWDVPVPVAPRQQVDDWENAQGTSVADEWVEPARQQWAAPAANQEWVEPAPVANQAPAPRQRQIPAARDAAGIFDSIAESQLAGTGRGLDGRGQLIISFSGKGGVGKSTTTINIARMAAKQGKRVIVIDGNSGQGDLRTYLRLSQTDLPTIYDAATTGDPSRAILTPAIMNQHRNPNLGAIEFAFVAAPPDDLNDADIVTNSVYSKVIDYCRSKADLVVLDTQIIESADKTGVVSTVILPALVGGAWGIGVADMSNPGVNNLQNRLRKFNREGAATDRFMILFNRVELDEIETAERASQLFRTQGTYLGAITMDPAIKEAMNSGRIDPGSEAIDRAMATALYRITNDPEFRIIAERELVTAGVKRSGFFSRIFGRGNKK